MKEYAILYDSTYCTGCNTCSYRCIQEFREHDTAARGIFRNLIEIKDEGMYDQRCMQCADPQCVHACAAGALTKSNSGAVLFNTDRCTGDGHCVSACPFHGIKLDTVTRKAVKCNMCAHRLVEGRAPVCIEACPAKALQFGELSQMLVLAQETAKKGNLKLYGAKENGGTHFIILTKEAPASLGYPAVAATHSGKHAIAARLGALPLVAGVALAGLQKLTKRREEVARQESDANIGND
jgi:formate dehydrogenase iron-sulfur subunit